MSYLVNNDHHITLACLEKPAQTHKGLNDLFNESRFAGEVIGKHFEQHDFLIDFAL